VQVHEKFLNITRIQHPDGVLKPDPERVKPVLEIPVPTSQKQLQRVVGMFACYKLNGESRSTLTFTQTHYAHPKAMLSGS